MTMQPNWNVRVYCLAQPTPMRVAANTPVRALPAEIPERFMDDFGTDEEDVAGLTPVALADTEPGETIMLYDNATGAWWACVVVEHVADTDAAN